MKKCKVLRDYHNDKGKKRKAGSTISLRDTAAKMRQHGGFVEILNPDKKPVVPQPAVKKKAAAAPKPEAIKKPEIKMKDCKVLMPFFDCKPRKVGKTVTLTDAEANRHALAGRVKIIKPKEKKPAAPKPKAISSDKKSAGALAKKKPKKKPARGKKK